MCGKSEYKAKLRPKSWIIKFLVTVDSEKNREQIHILGDM